MYHVCVLKLKVKVKADVTVLVLAVLVCGRFEFSVWPFWSDLWPFWFVAVLDVIPTFSLPHL